MLPLPTKCPICGGEVMVMRLSCRECEVILDGRFTSGPLNRLSPEQIQFVETFLRYEGKLTRMEDELQLSYPTIRNRLHDVIRALGYEPGGEASIGLTESERGQILEDLDQGRISTKEAMRLLQEGEG
ncbi:MAG TPA: DUF2089 domain-containing protein [Anaerolineales bacterium]|nr:DUF2089 domain-containing protein [Anaerolineales bacterium]